MADKKSTLNMGQWLRRFDTATNAHTEAVFARGEVLWELRWSEIKGRPAYEANRYKTWKECLVALSHRAKCGHKALYHELGIYSTFFKVFPAVTSLAKEVGPTKLREIYRRWDSYVTYVGAEGFCNDPKVLANVKQWLAFCKNQNWARVSKAHIAIPIGRLEDPARFAARTPSFAKPSGALFAKPQTLTAMEGASMTLAIEAARADLNAPNMSDGEAIAAFVAGALSLVSKNKKLRLQLTEAVRASQNVLKAA